MNDSSSPLPAPPMAPPTIRTYLGISLFWFALSFFWGAMLVQVMPQAVFQIVGDKHKDQVLAVVQSSGAFISALTQIIFGAFSDNTTLRMGRRKPYLIFGTLLTTLVLLFLPGARTVGSLMAVYWGIQLFLNIANGPYQALMPDIVPTAYHGRASAYMGVASLLGRIGGPVVGAWLLSQPNGLQLLTWVFVGLLNVLMLLNAWILREEPVMHSDGVANTLKGLLKVPLRPYPDFLWLLISRFGIMMGVYTILPFLQYYVRDALHVPDAEVMATVMKFLVAATGSGFVGVILAGVASDRYSKKIILYIANAISMVAAGGFALAQNTQQALIAVTIYGVGAGTFAAVDWALAAGLLPPGAPAKYMGFWSLSDTMPQVVAPIIAGPLAAYCNAQMQGSGYRWIMAPAVVYFVLGTVAIARVREPKHTLIEEIAHSETPLEDAPDAV